MKNYELITILKESESVDETVKTVEEIIKRYNGQVSNQETWGRKNLSYARQDINTGSYHLFQCKMPAESVKEVARELKIQGGLLQFMIKAVA
ncbi:MAG TPA: 30S ribosomal protein S6 [Leptospiraceae bacterium]|nr:30S ribosomal protein S6 [Leptospiraceae bacterium]